MSDFVKISAGGPVTYDYEIQECPVTNAEYAAWLRGLSGEVAASHYCRLMELHFFGGIRSDFSCKQGFDRKPVVFVNWYDARAYAKSQGGRLPTVAEWKKAAAWLPDKDRYATWCTGLDDPPSQTTVNYYDFEEGWALPSPHLADVDWYQSSGSYGCRGMAGNVGEWCEEKNSEWQPALGGSLFRPLDFCRVNAGEADHPSKRLSTFGFRLVREV